MFLYFQAKLAVIANGPLIIRILKDFISRNPKWSPFTPWVSEIIAINYIFIEHFV